MLAKIGIEFEFAENGQIALEAVLKGDYSAVLMDCQMPILDGYKATKKIRQSKNVDSDLPIIAITANALAGDREACLKAGMNEYLSKPVSMKALSEMLESFGVKASKDSPNTAQLPDSKYKEEDTLERVLKASEEHSWTLESVLPKNTILNFNTTHLPEPLLGALNLNFLNVQDRRTLSHIRGYSYTTLFAFVEHFIIRLSATIANERLTDSPLAGRAFFRFTDEEIKHQQLFDNYAMMFERDFPHKVKRFQGRELVSQNVSNMSRLGILLFTLHLELITQYHYISAIKSNEAVDPLFSSILHRHWTEEAQHSRLDRVEIDRLQKTLHVADIETGINDYKGALQSLSIILNQVAEVDLDNFCNATKKSLNSVEFDAFLYSQKEAYQLAFVTSGEEDLTMQKILNQLIAGTKIKNTSLISVTTKDQ